MEFFTSLQKVSCVAGKSLILIFYLLKRLFIFDVASVRLQQFNFTSYSNMNEITIYLQIHRNLLI